MVNRFSYGSDCTDGMLLRFEHAIATTQVSFRAIAPETAWFCGDRGSIQLLGGHKGGGAVLYGPDRQEIERFIPPEENGFVYEIEEFIRGVREGRLESDVIPIGTRFCAWSCLICATGKIRRRSRKCRSWN
mgnify:CR=1 FL=1